MLNNTQLKSTQLNWSGAKHSAFSTNYNRGDTDKTRHNFDNKKPKQRHRRTTIIGTN